MTDWVLTYARVVILKRTLKAENYDAAVARAFELEDAGELGLADLDAKEGSDVDEVQDYDVIWNLEIS